ncbi:Uncharacterised protein [Vibrio cholerae]|nr:Uncharacterised protein [Vibrio cholerae]
MRLSLAQKRELAETELPEPCLYHAVHQATFRTHLR